MCRLIPAPRGTGLVAAPASKRLLQLAGVEDCYTQSKGSTATMGNFLKATFAAVRFLINTSHFHTDTDLDHKNIRLPHTRPVARDPRLEVPVRRAQRASPACGRQEGILDVLGGWAGCLIVCH